MTPKFRYAYLEEFDKINTVLYSHIVKQTLDERYKKLMQRVPGVIIDMEKRVYIFNNYFIGYDTSEEIETLFSDLAFYDATQAVEWWCFSHDSLFGDVKYGIYVNTIVYFMGIALKHHQFCQVLLKTNPKNKKLMMHNLICAIKTESELVEFISERNNVSSDDARKILKTISIDCSNYKNHTEIYSAQAPFIKLSNHQYIMSINGCLDRPFEFLLSELKLQYKKEWDKNTSEREGIFKQDLYAYFRHDGKYKTFSENIIIVTKDEKKTDIDACVYDESTGDILFVQLKWQDLTYDSIRSLASKRKNYHEKAIMWINTVNKWIVDASEKDIADRLHVGPRFIDKKKIKLLVLGRFNGNYSTDSIQYDNVVFGQWYQLLRIVNEYKNGDQLLTRIYNDLKKESRIIFNKAKRKREFSFEDKKIVIE